MENESKRPLWMPDTPSFIVVSLFAIFFIVLLTLMYRPPTVNESIMTLLTALIGMLAQKMNTVIDFHFGSSRGSKDKDDAQNKMVDRVLSVPLVPPPAGPGAPVTTTTTVTPDSTVTKTEPAPAAEPVSPVVPLPAAPAPV